MLENYADIKNELDDIFGELSLLEEAILLYEADKTTAPKARIWMDIQGIASGAEKSYSGCERVMAMIVNHVDQSRITKGDGWHIALLKRMSHPFEGIRGPVISQECFALLDRLRAFRHRQRNTYGTLLDPEIVIERARDAISSFSLFRGEVLNFAGSYSGPKSSEDHEDGFTT